MRTLSAISFFSSNNFFFFFQFRRIVFTLFLCNKKHRLPCSFKRKGPSHLFNYASPGYQEFAFRERKDKMFFALSTISTLSLSFLFFPCQKSPALFPNHAFPKRPFFSRARKGKESGHYILLPITCYYAQYRMRSAILRNHFKGKLLRSPYLGLFMFAFIQIKSKINKKSRSPILTH